MRKPGAPQCLPKLGPMPRVLSLCMPTDSSRCPGLRASQDPPWLKPRVAVSDRKLPKSCAPSVSKSCPRRSRQTRKLSETAPKLLRGPRFAEFRPTLAELGCLLAKSGSIWSKSGQIRQSRPTWTMLAKVRPDLAKPAIGANSANLGSQRHWGELLDNLSGRLRGSPASPGAFSRTRNGQLFGNLRVTVCSPPFPTSPSRPQYRPPIENALRAQFWANVLTT